ncbi:MAG TPA: glycoside hydrolase family 44 protein [Polyangia bacterium]
MIRIAPGFRSSILFLTFATIGAGCIKRTAPPPAAVGSAPASTTAAGAPATDVNAPNPVQEAANARIASLPRVDLLGGAGIAAFKIMGDNAKAAEAKPITVTGQPFTDAMRFTVKEASSHEWAVQIQTPTTAPVAAGDAILATFWFRTETPQEGSVGETEFVFELGRAPYAKSIQYPIQAGPEWVRVQARFSAAAAYQAGEANMIFRLGYEPQVLELGGVKVENFGKAIAMGGLPTSMTSDRRRAKALAAASKEAQGSTAPVEAGELTFDVDATKTIRTISPYVYGINSQKDDGIGVTVRRMGGNRQTGYNWELNASNAGSDYNHQSDEWPCTVLGYTDCTVPGAQFVDFAKENKALGAETLATIPLVDYVAADKNKKVTEEEKAPSARWVKSVAKKPGPLSLTPDLNDKTVYQDEFVNFLVKKLGKASDGGIKFYSLDNEPALWPSTHPRIHPERTRYAEMVKRTEAIASEVVKLDPSAQTLGAVAFGWSEYQSLSDAPDAKEHNDKYGTYLDYFLASMKELEAKHKKRLVHVLDVHWYPEARGTKRITDKDNSPKTVAARLQAPRSLWDPTYVEKSWITGTSGKPIRLIPWLQEKIAERYPGTKLSITEYDYGGNDHISGGLAQADVLGVFGREGLYLANYWGNGPGNGPLPPYIKAAYRLYRNYDGKHDTFGDTAVTATPADQAKASIYAATDSKHKGTLTILVINKELRSIFNGKIAIKGGKYAKAQVYTLDGSSAEVKPQAAVDIKNGQIEYKLQPMSATLFVVN